MGLGLDDFLDLTPYEFQVAYQMYLDKINADREWEYLKAMRVARWQVFRTLCPPQGKKKISVYDLVELPGDQEIMEHMKTENSSEESTEEKFKAACKDMGFETQE